MDEKSAYSALPEVMNMTEKNGLLAVVFDVPSMTAVQYDQVVRDLERAGLGAPNGRFHHLAAQKEAGWYVVDIWEKTEKLDRFIQALLPILQRNGVNPPQPQILPAYNIIG